MKVIEDETGRRLQTYLDRITPFGFSGAVLVAKNGEILLNQGFGLANRTTVSLNTANTVFNLGSITKQFTAAGILRLEMQGRLITGQTIDHYLPDVPADKHSVTLHHLLTHTAGMPSYSGEDYEEAERDPTIRKILETPLEFAPGSTYRYSNTGYSLLAAVIEFVSGQNYEQFLKEQLFQPAGMNSTGYVLPGWEDHSLARGYVKGQDRGIPIEKPYPSWNVMGNGEMLSTTGDMYLWHLALHNNQVLSEAAKEKLWTPFLQEYAYGWRVAGSRYGRLIEHNGAGDTGMSALFQWYLEHNLLIVLFSNSTLPNGDLPITVIDRHLPDIAFGKEVLIPPAVAPKPASSPESYTGFYQAANGAAITIFILDDSLALQPENQAALDLVWELPENDPLVAEYNQRVNTAFGGFVTGNNEPLLLEMRDPKRIERYQSYLGEMGLYDLPPSSRSWIVFGSVPSWNSPRTITSMVIDTGSIKFSLQVHWEDNQIYGIRAMETSNPLALMLLPVDEHHFAGYDLAAAKAVQVIFGRGEIVLVTQSGRTVLRKERGSD